MVCFCLLLFVLGWCDFSDLLNSVDLVVSYVI